MKTRASSMGRFVVAVVTSLAVYAGCTTSKTGGETHWLGECGSDRECGTAQCLCGICTRVCGGDGDCAGPRNAQCYAVASPGIANQCQAAMPKGKGICLAVCTNDGDCPPGDECHLGACVAAPPPAVPADAATPAPKLPPTGDIAARYVRTDAGTAFGELVAAPEPSTFIDGDAEHLVGVWRQTEGDAGPCVPNYSVGGITYTWCFQLEITRDAATGKIVGYASFHGGNTNSQLPGPGDGSRPRLSNRCRSRRLL